MRLNLYQNYLGYLVEKQKQRNASLATAWIPDRSHPPQLNSTPVVL